ncbi:MAG TPA: ROK family protein [Candidatus Limnocylindrales bacterium]|nr:ROK family protein [Candidatus Limnocylindrales bacterium]
MTVARHGLGIDVGGTGVKAGVVDLETGRLVGARIRVRTPVPATPGSVAEVIGQIVHRLAEGVELPPDLPVGCGLPGVVLDRQLVTAVNIGPGWSDEPAGDVIGAAIGRRVHAINDADAAGMAEMAFGAGRGQHGSVLMLTVGTGIGSALFRRGVLYPNTELGHLRMSGRAAETRLSGAARTRRKLKWRDWAEEFNVYLGRLEAYLWPDLIILGGGVSKAFAEFSDRLRTRAPIVPAHFQNASGIIGAAMHAAEMESYQAPVPTAPELAEAVAGDGR